MKKRFLSLLCVAALLISIGGVYATWSYAQSSAGEVTRNYDLSLTSETVATKKGEISISSSGFTLEMDQKASGDYTAVLKLTGELKVSFTPSAGADPDVLKDGIVLQAAFTETYGEYTDTINSTPSTPVDILKVAAPFALNGGTAINGEYTLNNTILAEKLTLGTFQLESKSEYDAFLAYMADASRYLKLTISEYTA